MEGITIVIPALDEGAQLARTLADVQRAFAGREHRVIIVDDGSSDGSSDGLAAEDVRVVKNPLPMGYGHALKLGTRLAGSDLIGILDADATYDARDLVRLADAIGAADMAVGVRPSGRALGSPPRRLGKWLLKRFAEYLAEARIPDLNSGIRVFRREAALRHESVLPHGFSFTTTITLAMLADGRPVLYLPVAYNEREGRSKIRPLRDAWRFFLLILRAGCFIRPLKVFLPIGGVLLMLGVVRLAYDIFVLEDIGDSAGMFITSGLEVTLMGLIGELVVRRR